jgi:cell division protein FtsQ
MPSVALRVARSAPRLALTVPARLRRWIVLLLILAIALTTAYLAWFKHSSFVQVESVTVTGLSGPEAPELRRKLVAAGMQQSTLDVKVAEIRAAVAGAPEIRSITVSPDFPHALRIDVMENRPVAELVIPGRGKLPIAANGTLMPDAKGHKAVPELRVSAMPPTDRPSGQVRLDDPATSRLVSVAAAAPPALLHRAESVAYVKGDGFVVQLREGPKIQFGDDKRLHDKWAAAAGVLAAKGSSGASYVDVRLPERPVAGGLKVPGEEEVVPGATPTPGAATTPSAPVETPAATSTTTPASPVTETPAPTATPQQTAPVAPETGTTAPPANSQP